MIYRLDGTPITTPVGVHPLPWRHVAVAVLTVVTFLALAAHVQATTHEARRCPVPLALRSGVCVKVAP